MEVNKISTSRMSQYLNCPLEYYYDRHSDKQPKVLTDNTALHKGIIIHEALEKLRYKPEKDIVSNIIREANEDYDDYVLDEQEIKEFTEILKNWIDTRDIGYEIEEVEKYFKIPIQDFHLTGKIDVIERLNDSTLRVTDYKTGKSYKTEHDIRNSNQLKFYTLAMMELYEVNGVEASLDQIRHEAPEYIQYRRDDLVEFLQYIISVKNKIENDNTHNPSPGYRCSWCDYSHHCPVMEDMKEELDIERFDYGEMGSKYSEVHAQIKVLEDKKKQLKKMITNKMEKEDKERYEDDQVNISKRRNEYVNYQPKTVIENVPEEELNNVLKVKKGNLDDLELDKEERKEIDENTSRSYSNPYIRVS